MNIDIELMYDLANELNKAASLYYNGGNSYMSDEEYDSKLRLLERWEKETGVIYSHSPTQRVGAEILDGIPKVELGRPMLSLAKVHTIQEVRDFANNHEIVGSYKLDGLSVRLWYKDGKLVRAATRGNGTVGSDITNHVKRFANVPLTIPLKDEYIIDGEAIITRAVFDHILNKGGKFKNPRNLAAGTLALLDMEEVQRRRLKFIGWDVIAGDSDNSYRKRIKHAEYYGFEVICPYDNTISNINIMDIAGGQGYPCDGVVWRFDDIAYGASLGATAHHYNNGIAWKPKDETEWSKLIDIDWTMGRTGVLTPVAIFEPVELEGTEVERANLHNLSVMKELLGTPYYKQEVEIFKANLIIPQIKNSIKLNECREDGIQVTFAIPSICPICGAPLEEVTEVDSTVLWCPAADCSGKLLNKLDHFCSKQGMDIKGLSKATLSKLLDWGWIEELADLYKLEQHRSEWVAKPGFGPKSVDNILSAIEASRHADYAKFLPAIGIPMIGNSITKDIIKHPELSNYEDFRAAVDASWDFTKIDGIGYEKAGSILTFDYTEADKVYQQFVSITSVAESTTIPADNPLEGQAIVITGSLEHFKNRNELTAFINERGGKVTGSVSKNTTLLINNDPESSSSKNRDAKRLGIPILTEKKFLEEYLTF